MTPSEFDWLTALCEREYPKVAAYCRRHLKEEQDANDACQETFTRAVLHWDKLRACERPGGWLMEAARRVCLEVQRNRQRWTRSVPPNRRGDDPAPTDALTADDWRRREAAPRAMPRAELFYRREDDRRAEAFERGQWLRQLGRVAERLPAAERAVVRLALEGLSVAEIAAQLDLNEAAVHTRLHRARSHLATFVGRERELREANHERR